MNTYILLFLLFTRLTLSHYVTDPEAGLKYNETRLLLDQMLIDNNPILRPSMNKSTTVRVQVHLVGVGPVNDLNDEFVLSMFLRLNWTDPRLAFQDNSTGKFSETKTYSRKNYKNKETEPAELRLDGAMSRSIWFPDLFFRNAKHEHAHWMTKENKLIRINGQGRVLSSTRISLIARCPMRFDDFPFDVHTCNLFISSYQYNKNEVWLEWNAKGAIEVPKNTAIGVGQRLLQFNLTDTSFSSTVLTTLTGDYCTLVVCFQFTRYTTYYIFNTFIPCYLLVTLSQVSFWINKDATPARMTYGSTTVLALTGLAIGERNGVPTVSYITAYDIYLTVCFMFCFAALIEFAFVDAFTVVRPKNILERATEKIKFKLQNPGILPPKKKKNLMIRRLSRIGQNFSHNSKSSEKESSPDGRSSPIDLGPNFQRCRSGSAVYIRESLEYKQLSVEQDIAKRQKNLEKIKWLREKYRRRRTVKKRRQEKKALLNISTESVLDQYCRILFPLAFFIFNFCYFRHYTMKRNAGIEYDRNIHCSMHQ